MEHKNILNQIQILLNQFNAKNFEHVISKCKLLLKKNPQYIVLYNLIGSAYQNIGDYINAREQFKNGLKLEPNNNALMNNLAMSHKNLLEYQLANDLYLQIINTNDKYINAYVNLGNLKRDLNDFDEAIKLYEKALVISNKNPIIYYSLGLAHQGIGNFEKAIDYSKKTLELNKNFTRADHLISQSMKYKNNDEHYIDLKNKINDPTINEVEKIDLYFSLAKAEEDIGDIKKCSEMLIKGNKLKRKSIKYNIYEELSLLEDLKKKFKELKIKEINKNTNNNYIFILGMPRSGTSLVEQIVTSHSNVFGGGELPILSNIVKKNFIKKGKLIEEFNDQIQNTSILNSMNREYSNFIKNFKFEQEYITDKAPLNFRWIGFIKFIFPDAKIIHCSRNSKNNCLSMFKNLFEGGLNFTYDQEELIKYYNQYLDLISFWKSMYPDSILDVQYENLISNKDYEIKRIIKFCSLKWEDNCLSFHNNKTPIKTMSTAQARKPIYKSSLNAFDKFKEYFKTIDKGL